MNVLHGLQIGALRAARDLIRCLALFALGVACSQGLNAQTVAPGKAGVRLEVFVREGCARCADAKEYLSRFQAARPAVEIVFRDVLEDPAAMGDLVRHSSEAGIKVPAVPTFVVDRAVMVGFVSAEATGPALEAFVDGTAPDTAGVETTLLGRLRASHLGLPLFSLAMGLLDGLNPCAIWTLVLLLSMLMHLRDRKWSLLIAVVFLLTSGAFHYALMAAWLNTFLVLGTSRAFEQGVGVATLVIGLISVKEFFAPGRGMTLGMSAGARGALASRARRILVEGSRIPALASVAVLALVANVTHLLCTSGLPVTFTTALGREDLTAIQSYGYLGIYVVAYMIPASILIGSAAFMLTSPRLTVEAGRWLKLTSGVVMIGLAWVLLRPAI